jgi:hypothetical protein
MTASPRLRAMIRDLESYAPDYQRELTRKLQSQSYQLGRTSSAYEKYVEADWSRLPPSFRTKHLPKK